MMNKILRPSRANGVGRFLSAFAFSVLGFFAISGFQAADAADLAVLSQATPHDAIYDVAFDGDQGVAVGAYGLVMNSKDGGVTWEKGTSPANNGLALLGVAARDGRRMAVGQQGSAFRFESDKWTALTTGTEERLLTVALGKDGLVVAGGGFGALLVSQDNGASWQQADIDWFTLLGGEDAPHIYGVSINNDTITVVGEFALVLQSVDRGKSWAVAHKGEASLFGLTLNDQGAGLAVGQNGLILRTGDGGASWQQVPVKETANLLGVGISGQKAFVSGFRAALQSSDGGVTWERASYGDLDANWYEATAVAPANSNFILVGHSGRIAAVTN